MGEGASAKGDRCGVLATLQVKSGLVFDLQHAFYLREVDATTREGPITTPSQIRLVSRGV